MGWFKKLGNIFSNFNRPRSSEKTSKAPDLFTVSQSRNSERDYVCKIFYKGKWIASYTHDFRGEEGSFSYTSGWPTEYAPFELKKDILASTLVTLANGDKVVQLSVAEPTQQYLIEKLSLE